MIPPAHCPRCGPLVWLRTLLDDPCPSCSVPPGDMSFGDPYGMWHEGPRLGGPVPACTASLFPSAAEAREGMRRYKARLRAENHDDGSGPWAGARWPKASV